MKQYVCVDIGGTSIKYGILDEDGNILKKNCIDTEAYKGGKFVLEKTISIIERCRNECEIQGIGISTAGMVDCRNGEIFYSGELIPGYTGTNYKHTLESRFGISCEVENDVNCAGLAEWHSGAAQGSHVAVCLTVGTGIGGCIILNGEVFHGHSNSACEIGYMPMDGSDFQTLGATSIMTKKVARIKGEDEKIWDGKRIFEEAKKDDAVCQQAIDEMCDVLGRGIANICYMINPEVVVLGGGIMVQQEILRPKIENAMRKYLKPIILAHTRLEFAQHGNDAGMLGAFWNLNARLG